MSKTRPKSMKADYYELLEVELHCNDAELKRAYRKKALQFHPDKNPDNVEEATRVFAEIKAAYEVLSDPQERAWYDSHKSQILDEASGDASDQGISAEELLRFFDPVLFQRFDDSVAGLYVVAGRVFESIAAEEVSYGKQQGLKDFEFYNDDVEGYVGLDSLYPHFGHSNSEYEKTVREFYVTWGNFNTVKLFSWKDNYKYSQSMDRRTRRAIEKNNKKARDMGKKEYNETVRSLVTFIKKRDPRVKKGVETLERRRKEKQKEEYDRQLEQQRLAREKMQMNENFELQDWQKYDLDELDQIESHFSDGGAELASERSEEEVVEMYECVVCDKVFKSDKQFKSHEKSKKHKKELNKLRWEMRKEGIELGIDDDEFQTAEEDSFDEPESTSKESGEPILDIFKNEPKEKTLNKENETFLEIDNDINEFEDDVEGVLELDIPKPKSSKKKKNKKHTTEQKLDEDLKKLTEAIEKGVSLDSDDEWNTRKQKKKKRTKQPVQV